MVSEKTQKKMKLPFPLANNKTSHSPSVNEEYVASLQFHPFHQKQGAPSYTEEVSEEASLQSSSDNVILTAVSVEAA